MSEVGELYADWKEEVRKRREDSLERNMETLFNSEFNFPRRFDYRKENRSVLFREKGKPNVNFYPSGNKWVVNNKTMHGNAAAFLIWYRAQ